jgi:hypothetical protein
MSGSVLATVVATASRAALLGGLALGCTPAAEDHGVPAAYIPPYSGPDVAMPYGQGIPDSYVSEVGTGPADAGSTATDATTAADTGPDCTPTNVGGTIICL